MTDLVVVTALLGFGPDKLGPPPPVVRGVRYVCVTDRDTPLPAGWQPLPYLGPPGSARLQARWVRACLATTWPVSLWLDASFDLRVSPRRFVEEMDQRGVDLLAFAHPDRRRMSDEAAEMVRLGKMDAGQAARQVARYQFVGWDTDAQPQQVLTVGGMLVRRATPQVCAFGACWWDEIVRWGDRSDQLSVDYCAAQVGLSIGHIPMHYAQHPWLTYDRKRHLGLTVS